MTIEQLYCFLEVFHYKSITKAATNLGVSRQAISNSLKKLESEFNVELFERSANGATPTKAGQALYKHASVIIREVSAINQNMLDYNEKDETIGTCRIGMAESLLLTFGEDLLKLLSDTFPNIYFDISIFEFSCEEKGQYSKYDICIPVLFESQYRCMFDQLNSNYIAAELNKIPVYVWISEDSPYNQYDVLNFSILRDLPCCTLKNSYNINNLIKVLEEDTACSLKEVDEIYLKNNFVDSIEKFGYYTVDFPVINNKFFYEDVLKDHDVVLKRTNYYIYKSIVYNKTTCQNIYPIVVSVLA